MSVGFSASVTHASHVRLSVDSGHIVDWDDPALGFKVEHKP